MSDAGAIVERVFGRASEIGLSDEDLTRLSGLSAELVAKLRSGEVPSAHEYEQLCRAVAVDPSALYRGEESLPRRTPARFRAAFSTDRPSPMDMRCLVLAAEEGRILAHLIGLLGQDVPLEKHRRVSAISESLETWKEGYELGEQARRELDLPDGPIRCLEGVLRNLGVQVARTTFSSPSVDAASIWEPGAVPIVVLNSRSPRLAHPGVARSALAHELCRLLHDGGRQDNLLTRVSWGVEGTGDHSEIVEKRARAFAPAFLAPRNQVNTWARSLAKSVRDRNSGLVQTIAGHWGLSFEGAAWHARNCRLITAGKAEQLANMNRKPRIRYDGFEASAQVENNAELEDRKDRPL